MPACPPFPPFPPAHRFAPGLLPPVINAHALTRKHGAGFGHKTSPRGLRSEEGRSHRGIVHVGGAYEWKERMCGDLGMDASCPTHSEFLVCEKDRQNRKRGGSSGLLKIWHNCKFCCLLVPARTGRFDIGKSEKGPTPNLLMISLVTPHQMGRGTTRAVCCGLSI